MTVCYVRRREIGHARIDGVLASVENRDTGYACLAS